MAVTDVQIDGNSIQAGPRIGTHTFPLIKGWLPGLQNNDAWLQCDRVFKVQVKKVRRVPVCLSKRLFSLKCLYQCLALMPYHVLLCLTCKQLHQLSYINRG